MLGLDPDPRELYPEAQLDARNGANPSEAAAAAVLEQCRILIESVGDLCVGVKPQLACFERLGAAGRETLDSVIRLAREAGLIVIADGKRGDVPHTARAYAEGFFKGIETQWGLIPGLGADAVTVNPYMGNDSLEAFIEGAVGEGAGVFILVRTSNPGAEDVQDLECGTESVYERIAASVARLGEGHIGQSGLSSVGAVVGATSPDLIGPLRTLMPRTPFLLPGIGAQGGRLDQVSAAFEPQPAAALVTASRSITDAYKQEGGDPASAARREAERLRDDCWRVANE